MRSLIIAATVQRRRCAGAVAFATMPAIPVKAIPAPRIGEPGLAHVRHLGSDWAVETPQGSTFLKPTRLCLDDCVRTAQNMHLPTQCIRPAATIMCAR